MLFRGLSPTPATGYINTLFTSEGANVVYPVAVSDSSMVLDALPALKATCWCHTNAGSKIYSFARFYLAKDGLTVALYSFERQPSDHSAMALALNFDGSRSALLQLTPREAGAYFYSSTSPPSLTDMATATQKALPPASYFHGEDEQGWYWGAQLLVPYSFLEAIGYRDGHSFRAGFLKYSLGQPGYGASFTPLDDTSPLQLDGCGIFAPSGW